MVAGPAQAVLPPEEFIDPTAAAASDVPIADLDPFLAQMVSVA